MEFSPAEIKMLRESLANLDYLIEKVSEPEVNQSFREQRDRCKNRLAELESMQKLIQKASTKC
jgi:hypothetical protein